MHTVNKTHLTTRYPSTIYIGPYVPVGTLFVNAARYSREANDTLMTLIWHYYITLMRYALTDFIYYLYNLPNDNWL